MPKTSTLDELSKRLKERNEIELKRIEEIEREKLKSLRKSLSELSERELNTLLKDIRKKLKEVSKEIDSIRPNPVRHYLIPLITGLSLMAGLGIGAWGLAKVAAQKAQKIESLQEQIGNLQENIESLMKIKKNLQSMEYVVHVYQDGIELNQEPELIHLKNGNWGVKVPREGD